MATSLPQGFPEPTSVGEIEIKSYPDYRAVTYTHKGDSSQATRQAFDPLFQHISRNQIAMTTPVEARYYDEVDNSNRNHSQVSFLYSSPEIVPQQVQSDVEITDTEAMTVVSIGIQGGYTWESYQKNLQKLQNWLQQHPEYKAIGSPRRLFYNSPMTPELLKYSEVQIPVEQL
ncbi:MAG: heme-binding protein [Microcoleaceae cyanobacterium]